MGSAVTRSEEISKRKQQLLRVEQERAHRVETEATQRTLALVEEYPYVFTVEPRCRVCMSAAGKAVNQMLAFGMTYKDILKTIDPINELLAENRRITVNSVHTHATKHFPIEAAAQATYRKVIETRAEEAGKDFVYGVNGALTPLAYLDVVMRKGFENLVDDDTKVEVETGMKAARDLYALTESQEDSADVAELMIKMNTLVEAVKTSVPEELWPVILAKIEGREVIETVIEDVTPYDPEDPDFGVNAADFVPDDPETNEDIGHF